MRSMLSGVSARRPGWSNHASASGRRCGKPGPDGSIPIPRSRSDSRRRGLPGCGAARRVRAGRLSGLRPANRGRKVDRSPHPRHHPPFARRGRARLGRWEDGRGTRVGTRASGFKKAVCVIRTLDRRQVCVPHTGRGGGKPIRVLRATLRLNRCVGGGDYSRIRQDSGQ
jgi:hypothetical protein